MNGKVRIKFGDMEIDFEGSEQFLKDEFLELIKTIHGLAKESGVDIFQKNMRQTDSVGNTDSVAGLGINTIAQKLGVSTGPDLTMAAAIKLDLVDGKTKFTTKELTSEMRKATSYFKETYAKNTTSNLSSLIKAGKLNDVGSGNYSVPANVKGELTAKFK